MDRSTLEEVYVSQVKIFYEFLAHDGWSWRLQRVVHVYTPEIIPSADTLATQLGISRICTQTYFPLSMVDQLITKWLNKYHDNSIITDDTFVSHKLLNWPGLSNTLPQQHDNSTWNRQLTEERTTAPKFILTWKKSE